MHVHIQDRPEDIFVRKQVGVCALAECGDMPRCLRVVASIWDCLQNGSRSMGQLSSCWAPATLGSLFLYHELLQPYREGTRAERHTKWEMSKCHETKSIAWSQSCFSPFPVSDLCVCMPVCVCVTPGLLYLLHSLLSLPLQMLQSMIMKAGVQATRQAHHCNQNNCTR